MIATFFEVHHDIEEGGIVWTSSRIQSFEVSGKNVAVEFSLHGRQIDTNDKLAFPDQTLNETELTLIQYCILSPSNMQQSKLSDRLMWQKLR